MRADASFAVPVKLWALLCVFAGVTIGGNVLLTCILTGGALLYLVLQRNFRLAASYGCFYLLLALLLYGIRFHGLRMPVFSEFYVLMFWNLSPIFLVSWDLITTPPGMLSAFLSRLRMPPPVHSRASCGLSLFPHHADGAERRRQVHEKPGADRGGAAARTSRAEHGVCAGSVSSSGVAACRSAFRFRRCKGCGAPGCARQLL